MYVKFGNWVFSGLMRTSVLNLGQGKYLYMSRNNWLSIQRCNPLSFCIALDYLWFYDRPQDFLKMLWTTAVSIEYLFDLKGVSVFSKFLQNMDSMCVCSH